MDFKEYALSHQTEICLELDRVRRLLQKAGNPDKKLKIIHVAGTNGKGSVCSFICKGLEYMGHKTGRFSSPELICINDTITVDGCNIGDDDLQLMLSALSDLSHEVESELGKAPSQFEISFVAALLYFVKCGCEYAVLECGMGGIGDATNSISESVISVITHIALDHTAYLGNTLGEIAANKCGIIKRDSIVVTGNQDKEVYDIIQKMSDGHRLIVANEVVRSGYDRFCEIFDYDGIKALRCGLCGIHQPDNAAIAVEVLKLLDADESCIRFAIQNAANPARMEMLAPGLYFDGAHNCDGVKMLVDSLNRYEVEGKIVFVTGFMKDKNYKEALSLLASLDNADFEIYTVNVRSNPRSESADRLRETALSLGYDAKAFDNVNLAISQAKTIADTIFVFGSLYMYKELEW